MHVVILGPSDLSYNSGSIIYIKNLYRHMQKYDVDVTLFSCVDCFDSDINKKDVIINTKLLEHPIITDRDVSPNEIIFYFSYTMQSLLKLNSEKRIDVIHVLYASFLSHIAIIIKKILNIPVIISCFGRDINLSNEYKLNIWSTSISIKEADIVIVSNLDIKKKVIQMFEPKNIICLNMPIDIIESEVQDRKKSDEKLNIVTINSCFKADKNIDAIIRSIKDMENVNLYIVGTDDHPDQKNYKRLKKLCIDLEVADKVFFTGFLDREGVFEILRSKDLFIDARLGSNFSSVLLEAIYCDIPILSSKNSFANEIFGEDLHRLFEPSDIKYLTQLIQRCFNVEYRNQLLQRQIKWKKRNMNKFFSKTHYQKIFQIYKEMVL